jgi:hypothetical protein
MLSRAGPMKVHFDRVRAAGAWSRRWRSMAGPGGLFAGCAAESDRAEGEAGAPAAGYGDHLDEPGAGVAWPVRAGGDREVRVTHWAQLEVA